MGDGNDTRLSGRAPLDLPHDLPHIDFRHDDRLYPLCQFTDALLGERPDSHHLEHTHPQPLLPRLLHRQKRRAGRDAVGDDHDLGVLDAILDQFDDVVPVVADLGDEAGEGYGLLRRRHHRIPALVVGQAGHVDAVARPRDRERRHAVLVRRIR